MNRYFRFYTMDIDAREAMLVRLERLTELWRVRPLGKTISTA